MHHGPAIDELGHCSDTRRRHSAFQFGYTISVPWSDVQKCFGTGASTNVVFAGGRRATLLAPEVPDLLDMFAIFPQDQGPGQREEAERVHHLFAAMGHEEFYARMLSAHPSGFSVFMTKRSAQQLKILLMGKVSLLARASATYSFSDGQHEGFQLGNPETDSRCGVILFDGSDTPVHFWISRESGSAPVATQREMSQIIGSFRWIKEKPNAGS